MIEIDYELKIDFGREIKTFNPGNPDKITEKYRSIPTIAYVSGPNQYGKSNLLNMIALAFHGLDDEADVNKILIDDVKKKIESVFIKGLTFSFTIFDSDKRPIIKSIKEDPIKSEFKTYEYQNGNWSILPPRSFFKKYKLIYEIPDNPTRRVQKLCKEVEVLQNYYRRRVNTFRRLVYQTIKDINNSRDPNKLKTYKNNRREISSVLSQAEKELKALSRALKQLRKYTYSREFEAHSVELRRKKGNIKDLSERGEGVKREKQKVSNKLKRLRGACNGEITKLTNAWQIVLKHIENLFRGDASMKHYVDSWQDINFIKINSKYQFDENIDEIIEGLIRETTKIQEKDQDKAEYGLFYREIIILLEKYKKDLGNVKVKGIGKSISELVTIFKGESMEFELALRIYNNSEEVLQNLFTFRSIRNEVSAGKGVFTKTRALLREAGRDESGDSDQEERISNQLKIERDNLQSKVDDYDKLCKKFDVKEGDHNSLKRGVTTQPWVMIHESYNEEELTSMIKRETNALDDQDQEVRTLNVDLERLNTQISNMEQRQSHPLENKLDELNLLLGSLDNLESRIDDKFSTYLKKYRNKEQPDDDREKEYFSSISKYLGSKMKQILFEEDNYEVSEVDLINEVVRVKNDTLQIPLESLGTGKGHLAYLRALLNNPGDNRRMIVLLDEIADMDSKTKSYLFETMNDLMVDSKLIAAVCCDPNADTLTVTDKGT